MNDNDIKNKVLQELTGKQIVVIEGITPGSDVALYTLKQSSSNGWSVQFYRDITEFTYTISKDVIQYVFKVSHPECLPIQLGPFNKTPGDYGTIVVQAIQLCA